MRWDLAVWVSLPVFRVLAVNVLLMVMFAVAQEGQRFP